MPRSCSIDGCSKPVHAKGWCSMHFGRARRNGDPLKMGQHGGHAPPASSEPPDPAPARALRLALEQQRRIGNSFDWAWSTARAVAMQVAGPERTSWWMVFAETQDVWRSAYAGKPDERMALFAALGFDVDDRDPWLPHRRSAPEPSFRDPRRDGPSRLEPASVPWCT
jgi:hypothetical protein